MAVVHFAFNYFANCIYSINCLPSSYMISFLLNIEETDGGDEYELPELVE